MATRRATPLLLVLVALMDVSPIAQGGGGNPNPDVLPPGASFRGKSYGEWAATWWQAAFSIPVVEGDHPLFSGGAFEGDKGVVFLAAVVGQPATVEVTVSAGTPLFVPVINSECSEIEDPPFHGEGEEDLRACANGIIDNTSGLFAVIDGRPVRHLRAYRCESPLFQFGPLPEDNILGAPRGATSDSVDAGYYLLLAPLSVGRHVIRVGGTFDDFGASIDTTFHIRVVPRNRR